MIRYALTCADGHAFESWFASAAAFDDLSDRDRLICPTCGSTRIEKALMAPTVTTGLGQASREPKVGGTLATSRETALRALRRKIEATSQDVGEGFAAEARRIHLGDAPDRTIHGEARPDEARALLEDGIAIMPLPFRTGKTN